jgi:hypothetical protein
MSVASILSNGGSRNDQVVALYDMGVVKAAKPVVVVPVDPTAYLTTIEHGAVVTVHGWPMVGHAVMPEVDGALIEPVYACASPVFRPMRFK